VAEEQELKLTVTLDNQAAAALTQLQQTLQGISNTTSGGSSGMNNFGRSLQGASGHATNLHSSLSRMAAQGGFIGGAFFQIGTQVAKTAQEIAKAVLDVKAYSDAMVTLEVAARRASTSDCSRSRTVLSSVRVRRSADRTSADRTHR